MSDEPIIVQLRLRDPEEGVTDEECGLGVIPRVGESIRKHDKTWIVRDVYHDLDDGLIMVIAGL